MKHSFFECINGRIVLQGACFPSSRTVQEHVLDENLCSNEYALATVISCILLVLLVGSLMMASNFMDRRRTWAGAL
ncbi:hypothetical protein LguiB_012605 [Lonicera macranthoides]